MNAKLKTQGGWQPLIPSELRALNDFHATAREAARTVPHVNGFDADVIASMCVTALRAGFLISRGFGDDAAREIAGLVDLAGAYAASDGMGENLDFPQWLPIDSAN